jgi:hypothetical protein
MLMMVVEVMKGTVRQELPDKKKLQPPDWDHSNA